MTDAWTQAQGDYRDGRLEACVRGCREVLLARPEDVDALHLAGVALHGLGRSEEALPCLEEAARLDPAYPVLHLHQGIVLHALGRLAESGARLAAALRLDPALWEAHRYLGLLARASGNAPEASACIQRALSLHPRSEALHLDAGGLDRESGRLDEALAHFRTACALGPRSPKAAFNLGSALMDKGLDEEAALAFTRAAALDPGFAEARACLGNVRLAQGDLQGFNAGWAEARRIGLGTDGLESGWLFGLHADPAQDPLALCDAHRAWGRSLESRIQVASEPCPPDGRPLRVGYLSPDFRQHACAHFLEPLLRAHDRSAVRLYAYALVPRPDGVTARFRGLADAWCDAAGMDAATLAARVREDGIQVLVDLAGHTGGNRLETFAHRAAPVQLTWLGYPGTTGLTRIDGRIVDGWTDPPGTETHCTEHLCRLPGPFLCYGAPDGAPEPAPPPSLASGAVTFGSFNALSKLNDRVLALWSRILRELPGSRLLLKSAALTGAGTRARTLQRFIQEGVAPHRIELLGWEPGTGSHLARYGALDIALDPFPYNGTTTTCEALWMGVPVICLDGDRHAGRVGTSLLSAVGLPELRCPDAEAYVRAAVDLAGDASRLAAYRSTLRGRVAGSPLCDAPRFARTLEALYLNLWEARESRGSA